MTPSVAKCLVISKVLVADGMMQDEERTFLARMMDELGLDESERKLVVNLDHLDEAEALVKTLPAEERQQLVEQLFEAASADGKLSPHELTMVQRLTALLGL